PYQLQNGGQGRDRDSRRRLDEEAAAGQRLGGFQDRRLVHLDRAPAALAERAHDLATADGRLDPDSLGGRPAGGLDGGAIVTPLPGADHRRTGNGLRGEEPGQPVHQPGLTERDEGPIGPEQEAPLADGKDYRVGNAPPELLPHLPAK